MTEAGQMWAVDTRTGPNLDPGELIGVLAAHHDRVIKQWESLTSEQWASTSRNRDWTVHQTARHMVDGIEMALTRVTGAPPPRSMEGFNPNTTPTDWLAASAGESPAGTLQRYATATPRLRAALGERLATGDDTQVAGPYGPAHWSVMTVHGFWDAWLHERDIALPLGLDCTSSPGELRLAGLYGLLMVLVPLRGGSEPTEAAVHLTGDIDVVVRARTTDGGGITVAEESRECELGGDAAEVIDSLSGRGAPPAELLAGIAEPLTFFAAYMAG